MSSTIAAAPAPRSAGPRLLHRLKDRIPPAWRASLTRMRRPRWLYLLWAGSWPISDYAGRDRGTPIDRFYIEAFLDQHRGDVRGDCLELKDSAYTQRFGGANVTRSHILDINPENKAATILADLRNLAPIPDQSIDCFILTQTLQYIDDLEAAMREIHRVLRPGGVVLATLPTLGKMEGLERNVAGNFWRFTPDSARYIFSRHFGPEQVEVRSWGNAISSMSFFVGLAQEDVGRRRLTANDPAFPCIISVRARRA